MTRGWLVALACAGCPGSAEPPPAPHYTADQPARVAPPPAPPRHAAHDHAHGPHPHPHSDHHHHRHPHPHLAGQGGHHHPY